MVSVAIVIIIHPQYSDLSHNVLLHTGKKNLAEAALFDLLNTRLIEINGSYHLTVREMIVREVCYNESIGLESTINSVMSSLLPPSYHYNISMEYEPILGVVTRKSVGEPYSGEYHARTILFTPVNISPLKSIISERLPLVVAELSSAMKDYKDGGISEELFRRKSTSLLIDLKYDIVTNVTDRNDAVAGSGISTSL
jgi:hypothetical protein